MKFAVCGKGRLPNLTIWTLCVQREEKGPNEGRCKGGLADNDILGDVLFFSLPCLLSCFLRALCNVTSLFVVKRFRNITDAATISVNDRIVRVVAIVVINLTVKTAIAVNQTINTRGGLHTTQLVNGAIALFVTKSIMLTTILMKLISPVMHVISAPRRTITNAHACLVVYFVNIPYVATCGVVTSVFHKLNSSEDPVCFVTTNLYLTIIGRGRCVLIALKTPKGRTARRAGVVSTIRICHELRGGG